MLTGGILIDITNSAWIEWVGNERGCGIMNNMCEVGQDDPYGPNYAPAVWGSLALNIIIVNVENQDNRTKYI